MKTGMPGREYQGREVDRLQRSRDRQSRQHLRHRHRNQETAHRYGRSRPTVNASIFYQSVPLVAPNGVAIDPQGNIVVVNIGNPDVITFSPDGKVLTTEKAAQAGNDGLVIMNDGTKYVSSVQNGGVSRIRPTRRRN